MVFIVLLLFFFFKQKTAYEMRISDWSSDVCSSDLGVLAFKAECDAIVPAGIDSITLWVTLKAMEAQAGNIHVLRPGRDIQCHKNAPHAIDQIGRASCRERVCPYV